MPGQMTGPKKYLFTPGPVAVPPEVLLEMARPVIHHRTSEFGAIIDRARQGLKPLFGTKGEVVLLSASGTGAMEAAVVNLLAPGEHAVFVNAGKFGERWGKILAAHGMVGHEIKVEWGQPVRPEQVEQALSGAPEARAVFLQASETSTCTLHPVEELRAITERSGTLLVVDGVTSVGVFEQRMDDWGVDVLLTGSQKALMVPPGLAAISLSERAWERARGLKTPRYYFDLARELKAQRDEHSMAYTAPVSLVLGLAKALELIHGEGLERVFARHALTADATRAAATALGLKLLSQRPAPGVTGLLLPAGVDGGKVVRYMRDELNVGVQGGQDQMKGRLVRIGHMGYVTPLDALVAISALEQALAAMGVSFAPGAGVAAVQQRIAGQAGAPRRAVSGQGR